MCFARREQIQPENVKRCVVMEQEYKTLSNQELNENATTSNVSSSVVFPRAERCVQLKEMRDKQNKVQVRIFGGDIRYFVHLVFGTSRFLAPQ
jgi:hypothetical protein